MDNLFFASKVVIEGSKKEELKDWACALLVVGLILDATQYYQEWPPEFQSTEASLDLAPKQNKTSPF